MKTSNTKSPLISAIFTIVLGTLSYSNAVAGLVDEFNVLKAQKICDEKGKLWTKGAVSAEGYLRTDPNSGLLSYDSVARELLEKRYAYFEMPQQNNGSNKLFERAIGKGTRYYRFYLAPIDSPACAGFLEEIKRYPFQKLPFLRALGLPVDLCIASERTDESISRYEMNIDSDYQANLRKAQGREFDWITHWSIRDKSNGEIVAEISSNGYNHGPMWAGGHDFTCPNRDQVQLFEKSAIQPIPDPRLPEKIKWTNVEPTPFPLSFELKAYLLAEKQSERRMSEYDYSSHLNPVADNGNILLHSLYRLQVINPGEGIQANVQKAFGKGWIGFQYLRFEKGEISFFGQAIPSSNHSKEVAVFRYDRNARPLAAYRILLPEISFKGDVTYLVDHLSVSEDGIDLTLLDVTRGRNGVGMNVLTEYKLRAPIEHEAHQSRTTQ